MALSKTVLGPLIKSKIDAVADKTNRDDLFEAIADAVIEHITSAGVVNVVSVSGVTTGGASSGPGTGTIS